LTAWAPDVFRRDLRKLFVTWAESARINYEILALDETIAAQPVEKRVIFRDRTQVRGRQSATSWSLWAEE
jgi:hypothetical protein